VPLAASPGDVDVVWNGTHYVLAFAVKDCRSSPAGSACAGGRTLGYQTVRIRADGTLVDGSPRASVPPSPPVDPLNPGTFSSSSPPTLSSSADGQTLVLAGQTRPGYVRGHRIDGELALRGEWFVVSGQANEQFLPVLLGNDTARVAFWTDVRRGPREYDLFSTRLSPEGAALDVPAREQATELEGTISYRAAGAFGDTRSLVVFVRANAAPAGGYDLYGQRIGPDGMARDTEPLRLTRLANPNSILEPGVAWNGTEFVVAAIRPSGLFTIRVSRDGVASSPVPVPTSTYPYGPVRVERGTDGLLAVYGGLDTEPVRARRLSPTGMPLGEELVLGDGGDALPRRALALAYSGGQWLVAWATSADVLGVRVSDAGAILDATPLRLADGPDAETDPVLAPTPTGFLLTYGAAADVRVARIGAGGEVEDPGGLTIATRCDTGPQKPSALVTSGSWGLIAYQSLCRYEQRRVFVRSLSW
jgi:hypothetical protein